MSPKAWFDRVPVQAQQNVAGVLLAGSSSQGVMLRVLGPGGRGSRRGSAGVLQNCQCSESFRSHGSWAIQGKAAPRTGRPISWRNSWRCRGPPAQTGAESAVAFLGRPMQAAHQMAPAYEVAAASILYCATRRVGWPAEVNSRCDRFPGCLKGTSSSADQRAAAGQRHM